MAAEKDVPEITGAPQEVEYADIDFSLLKRNSKSERKQESTKTEYAEIKKAIKDKQEDKMVKGEEEEMMTEMDLKQSELEKEKEEDEPVYSTVNDVIDKIWVSLWVSLGWMFFDLVVLCMNNSTLNHFSHTVISTPLRLKVASLQNKNWNLDIIS